jgi:hypothetical protein
VYPKYAACVAVHFIAGQDEQLADSAAIASPLHFALAAVAGRGEIFCENLVA